MDIDEKDVVVHQSGSCMYKMRITFEDSEGNITIKSPEQIFEQVKEMVQKNTKEVRNTVGRISDLLLGTYPPGNSFYFANGWYFRKAIELMEVKYGKAKIEYDSEDISKEELKLLVVKLINKQSKQLKETAKQIMTNGLPEDIIDDED